MNKPQMILNFRISNDSAGNQRFTEDEIENEIINNNVLFGKTALGSPLLIRKSDKKIIGEFLLKKKS